jgi:hypothetical protein
MGDGMPLAYISLLMIYMLPTINAYTNGLKKKKLWKFGLINFAVAWTIIGWLIMLKKARKARR